MRKLTDRLIVAIGVVECLDCAHTYAEHTTSPHGNACLRIDCRCRGFGEPGGFATARALYHDATQARRKAVAA